MSAPTARRAVILATLAAATAASAAALAGDGDIVVIREVPPRVAYRAASGPARAADTAPNDQVLRSLGVDRSVDRSVMHELGDRDFASVAASVPAGIGTSVPAYLGASAPGANAGGSMRGLMTAPAGGGAVRSVGGAVQGSTDQLTKALTGISFTGRSQRE